MLLERATIARNQGALKELVCINLLANHPTKWLFRYFAGMAIIAPLRALNLKGMGA